MSDVEEIKDLIKSLHPPEKTKVFQDIWVKVLVAVLSGILITLVLSIVTFFGSIASIPASVKDIQDHMATKSHLQNVITQVNRTGANIDHNYDLLNDEVELISGKRISFLKVSPFIHSTRNLKVEPTAFRFIPWEPIMGKVGDCQTRYTSKQ